MKVCLDCPTLIPTGNRCAECRRRHRQDNPRGTRREQGYGPGHRPLRRHYAERMAQGETFTCWRCGRPIDPNDWDLGHDDNDRSIYRGPECRPCNRATASRRPTVSGDG